MSIFLIGYTQYESIKCPEKTLPFSHAQKKFFWNQGNFIPIEDNLESFHPLVQLNA